MSELQKHIENLISALLKSIGDDPQRSGLIETPKRVAKYWMEVATTIGVTNEQLIEMIKTFTEKDLKKDIVLVKNIDFFSLCEHHLLPFFGKASIAYIPNGQGIISGLSKLPRLLHVISYRPQVQERIGSEIVNVLETALKPRGVMVVLEAAHMCMRMRGVKDTQSLTQTIAVSGVFERDATKRMEILQMIKFS